MNLAVIIPAYNREKTVSQSIASVQRCGVAAEVIVVNDGSTDKTIDVARKCGVTVLSQANSGPAAARNTGLQHTTAPFLAFLDSDDIWLPGTAPAALAAVLNYPELDTVFCETLVGNSAGYYTLSTQTGVGQFRELFADKLGPDLYSVDRNRFVQLMLKRNQVFLGSTIVRRSALDRLGDFNPKLFGGEDYELCLRLAAGGKWAFLDRPLARYEKHAGGLSANQDRMSREFALALRVLLDRRDLFTSDEYTLLQRRHRELTFYYAYNAYDKGDLQMARLRFHEAIRYHDFRPQTLAIAASCYLPKWLNRHLRRFKQFISQ